MPASILPFVVDGYNPHVRLAARFVPSLLRRQPAPGTPLPGGRPITYDRLVRAATSQFMNDEDRVIVGVGIDHVDAGRIAGLLERFGERGERRLFTEGELERCRDRPRPAECLAARFAAKEAFVKALGTGFRGMAWTDIEVRGREGDPPRLALHGGARAAFEGRGGTRTHVSLTHEAGSATAVVVIEGDKGGEGGEGDEGGDR